MWIHRFLLVWSLTSLPIWVSFAQTNQTMPNVNERPSAGAHFIENDPLIDGEVLNDELWQNIPPFGDLVQTRPNAGQAASEKTEIRIVYTAEVLYVAVICFDAAPEKLVVSDARRDASLDNTDSFLFILDTFLGRVLPILLLRQFLHRHWSNTTVWLTCGR